MNSVQRRGELLKVIQSRESMKFLISDGEWTPDISKAEQFQSFAAAQSFCAEKRIKSVDYLLSFGETRFDVRFRIF